MISFASNFDDTPFLHTSETLAEADALHHVTTQLSAAYSAQLSRLGESQRQYSRMLRTQQTEAQVVAGMAALQREHASDKEMKHAMQQQQDMMNGMHQATTRDLTVLERGLETYEHVFRQLASACSDIHHVRCVYMPVSCWSLLFHLWLLLSPSRVLFSVSLLLAPSLSLAPSLIFALSLCLYLFFGCFSLNLPLSFSLSLVSSLFHFLSFSVSFFLSLPPSLSHSALTL